MAAETKLLKRRQPLVANVRPRRHTAHYVELENVLPTPDDYLSNLSHHTSHVRSKSSTVLTAHSSASLQNANWEIPPNALYTSIQPQLGRKAKINRVYGRRKSENMKLEKSPSKHSESSKDRRIPRMGQKAFHSARAEPYAQSLSELSSREGCVRIPPPTYEQSMRSRHKRRHTSIGFHHSGDCCLKPDQPPVPKQFTHYDEPTLLNTSDEGLNVTRLEDGEHGINQKPNCIASGIKGDYAVSPHQSHNQSMDDALTSKGNGRSASVFCQKSSLIYYPPLGYVSNTPRSESTSGRDSKLTYSPEVTEHIEGTSSTKISTDYLPSASSTDELQFEQAMVCRNLYSFII